MLEQEQLRSSDMCVQFVSHDQLVIGKDRAFRFDWVFPPNTSQVIMQCTNSSVEPSYCSHLGPTYIAGACITEGLYTLALNSFFCISKLTKKAVQKGFHWYPTWWP